MTIKTVSIAEISNITNMIINNSQGWEYNDSDNLPDDEQTNWNDRHKQACQMLSYIGFCMKQYACKKNVAFFVAYFQGVPVGALQFNPRDGYEVPEVDYLATHCGIRNCGVLLMEYAVNESLQLRKGGKLELYPLDNAVPAYLKMGFTTLKDNGCLYLDPVESPQWYLTNGRYRYRAC
ncbi:GNAT family N-acetyltransferase [Xenorhabdus sp. DI]|uniref:GNAT family N-acetyltransferase n=1 Tax=Xenorhabdus doucetiae TaxID=351671 RepID=UPI0019AB8B79|nr:MULTISPECIES: GNAT family N-acetyltransferase [unclassified Xenorhabdus]MBD2784107.1 GNAT family N-acetyltransferase [Xenorhabdus sp. 3]MBD2787768.1 GNAT family N-acetyltransferase [Xenorhabdus sp. DI]